MDFETSQRLFHAFDPQRPLRKDTEALYVPRSDSVVDELVREVRFKARHRFLLAGAVGSGKSTELYRILRRMEKEPRYLSILLDLFAQFRVDSLSASQVLFLIAVAILKTVPGDHDDIHKRLRATYLAMVDEARPTQLDLGKLLAGLSVLVAGTATGPAGAAVALAASKAVESMDLRVALPGKGRPLDANEPLAQNLSGLLNEIIQLARTHHKRRILLLVDGLDKVRDDEQIRDLFSSGLLSCPDSQGLDLVYAAPPSLRYQVGFGGGAGFDMLRLGLFDIVHRDGTDNPTELQTLRELLIKRIEAAGCQARDILPGGPDSEAVTELLRMSGGLTRDLIHVVRRALLVTSQDPGVGLTEDDLHKAVNRHARHYLDLLDLRREELLYESWKNLQRPGGEEVNHLLNDNLILIYDNGRPWARPHPMTMGRLVERFGEPGSRD